ncbi:MAG: hypothetical protein ACO20H_04295 [Bacteriovoracaceae bacterium]
MLTYLANKKLTISLGIVVLIFGMAFSISNISTQVDNLARLEGGLNTCFLRVNQTYTGTLIGKGSSAYVGQQFQRMTEECFAETLVQGEELKTNIESKTIAQINTLNTEVNWFHQNLSSKAKLIPSSLNKLKEIGVRFNKIEELVNLITGKLESTRADEINKLFTYKLSLFLISTILFSLLYFESKRREEKKDEIIRVESEANEEKSHPEVLNQQRAKRIIGEALAINKLNSCKELLSNLNLTEENKPIDKTPVQEIKVPKKIILKKESEKLEENVGKKMDLSLTISKVIERISSQLFTRGILLDLNLKEKISIIGNREQVETFLFHLFESYCNSFTDNDEEKKIKVIIKRLGRTVLLDVESVGETDSIEDNVDYNIVKEIISDLEGSLSFEEVMTKGGLKTRVQFRYVGDYKGRGLVTLKRGGKKKLLKEIQNTRLDASV